MTARSTMDDAILDQALAWQVALEQDDADWDGYMTWLEADSRHGEAFDSLALVSAVVADHRGEIEHLLNAQKPAVTPRKRFARSLAYAGGGIAAAIALMVAVPFLRPSQSEQIYAADGNSRSVALANGVNVTLSPATRIIVHGKDAGRIEVASGEAFFDVRHDPTRSLTVSAGDYSITDIGTRFSVNITHDAFRIGVSDGTVSIASPGAAQDVQLSAGHQLVASEGRLTVSPVAAVDVGSWRTGRLSYSDTPLSLVVADIARYSGKSVRIDPPLEKTHFSGTLVIGDGSKLLPDLATVMGARISNDGNSARIGVASSR